MASVVVALGGNAILPPHQPGTLAEQQANVAVACRAIARLLRAGWRLVITHGNGPQVGNILLQNEAAAHLTPPMPLDACGAESQGLVGYLLQQGLRNQLQGAGPAPEVATLLTQVEVDPADAAFANPTKPIGPAYTAVQARRLARSRGYLLREEAGRGWRRVVPSPEPRAIVEQGAIRALLAAGCIVISGGGGGIPVLRAPDGTLRGVEAVVDKDLAAARLARDVGADLLMILTDVDQVYVNYRQPAQAAIRQMTAAEGRRYQAEGHFRAGSMGPKVEAALRFVEAGGARAVIGALAAADRALSGEAGTTVVA